MKINLFIISIKENACAIKIIINSKLVNIKSIIIFFNLNYK